MNISKSRSVRLIAAMLLFIAGASAFASSGWAQDRGDKDRDQRDRGGRDDGDDRLDRELRKEKYRRDFNLKGYLTKLDDNKSGVLEKGELNSDRTRRYLSDMGIDVSKSVPIDLAVRQAESHQAKKRDAEREKFEDKVGPKLNSFGAEESLLGLDSFGAEEKESPEVASFDDRLSGLKQSDFDEKTLAEARKVLNGYDRDASGFLEGDEIGRIRWKDPSPIESDLNGDGRISMLEMAQRIAIKSEKSREKDGKRSGDKGDDGEKRGGDKEQRGEDGGRGEGEGGRGNRDRGERGGRGDRDRGGRNERDDRDRSRALSKAPSTVSMKASSGRSSASKSESSSSSKSSASKEKAFANYVENVFKKYDVDKDRRLSAVELKKMKRPFRGDSDKDGFLTMEEAINFIKGGQKTDNTSPKPSAPSPIRATKKPSRAATAAASGSLPSGKRGSLSDVDANADGQIQMSEFSSTWDEETLQSFRKTDANGDGILSATEWAERTD